MIDFALISQDPVIIKITFSGTLTREEAEQAAVSFGEKLQELGGGGFRIVCDMRAMDVMPQDVAEIFMAAQNQAVAEGMQRDAFIISSATVRMQMSRIAKSGARFEKLGPLQFFDQEAEAIQYAAG